ncbi:serine acetyltransferase [bacterium]|nr:MAG: serine acetyltransferase [bacterium]
MSLSDPQRHADAAARLLAFRRERCVPLRLRGAAEKIAEKSLALLFPHFAQALPCEETGLLAEMDALAVELRNFADDVGERVTAEAGHEVVDSLPDLHHALLLDAKAILDGDPAARSLDEVIVTYPGFFAIALHRLSHRILEAGFPLLPRLIAEHAHRETGIDIHPGATVGRSFFIDHGTGVVIGESSNIGHGVRLYQGVTLGALQVSRSLAGAKRHPTLEDNVVVYANATILGGETVIGHDSVIGGNAFITESIPPFSAVGRSPDVRARRDRGTDTIDFHI